MSTNYHIQPRIAPTYLLSLRGDDVPSCRIAAPLKPPHSPYFIGGYLFVVPNRSPWLEQKGNSLQKYGRLVVLRGHTPIFLKVI